MIRLVAFGTLVLGVLTACEQPSDLTESTRPSPESAMSEFYSNPGPEDTLMDPLIVAGPDVYPLVIEAVKESDMPNRRYAIGFLGNEEISAAIPTLLAIIEDETELPYFRGDALEAVYKIDEKLARQLAERYQVATDMLGRSAEDVLADADYLQERRSLEMAVRRWHE